MPPQWAASGRRMEIHMLAEFHENGDVSARIGPYLDMGVHKGRWVVSEDDVLRFWLEIDGFERFDVSLPKGKLFFACNLWGLLLGNKSTNNILTIVAKRFFVRKEKRMVGTFQAFDVPEDDPDPTLPPCRTKFRGGPVDEFDTTDVFDDGRY
uniref:Uncharacterized protein n=2 Tax=Lotharella globosa TaxID=91324 RepID=A0A7S4DI47_9EUKA|mmetsp:Transcript_10437/g.20711  ORF Transcript_10437/g.20711 Transcript_10437/m.20711 type:complete len:152 (-) Transcript_10437:84-539(-)